MPADQLLAIPSTRSCIGFSDAVLPKVSKARLSALGLSKGTVLEASQWIHVTRQLARMIADFPLERLDAWLAALPTSKRDLVTPDEVFPWAALLQIGITKRQVYDDALTDMARESSDDKSPIVWTTSDVPRHVEWYDERATPIMKSHTLRDEMLASAADGFVFYRKIAAGVDLHSVFDWY